MDEKLTYRAAGVNIDAGNALVKRIAPLAKATERVGTMGSLGGFGALFDLKATGYKDPILVSATDGVGTKLKIAQTVDKHDTIGIDLVAMCVNDLVVQGAEPLFFLDYFATGKLAVDTAENVIKGIAEGCKMAGCALVGGETAEMPSMYPQGEYDLAGFAVGVVERDQILPRGDVQPGDMVLGLTSNGLHSNGFSLVRHLVNRHRLSYTQACPFEAGRHMGDVLLAPTKIYVKSCLTAIRAGGVKALAHITGGGLLENIPRVLPEDCAAQLQRNAWTMPAVFDWIQKVGNMDYLEMLRTFNCGIGMVLIVDRTRMHDLEIVLKNAGESVVRLGQITKRDGEPVVMEH